jgi:hypothetical protein
MSNCYCHPGRAGRTPLLLVASDSQDRWIDLRKRRSIRESVHSQFGWGGLGFLKQLLAVLTFSYVQETERRRFFAHTLPSSLRNTKKSLNHFGVELASGATDDFVACVLE